MIDVLEEAKQLFDEELTKAENAVLSLWSDHISRHSLIREKARKPRRATISIPEGEKYDVMAERQRLFDEASDGLMEQLYTGVLSIGEWQEQFKAMLREFHTASVVIGKGGWDNVSSRDWGRMGPALKSQYRYLQGFVNHIESNRDDVSLGYLKYRAKLYGQGAVATAVLIETPVYIYDLLPWIPRDGQSPCLNKCHCRWVSNIVSVEGGWQIVEFTWHLGQSEHCEVCTDRNGHVEVLRVPINVTVPNVIGGY